LKKNLKKKAMEKIFQMLDYQPIIEESKQGVNEILSQDNFKGEIEF
jgi:hypothetical protein